MNFLNYFKLSYDKEDFDNVSETIENNISFKGSQLWILIFAIFIASLGLNLNSTAVIIGAMLVSPLMGPIMGIGFSMAINDIPLLRKSITSYLVATTIGLITSTIYFVISPLNDAHSEILARTSPNIYDVLIALFGGLAGMLATSSKLKGNVIPGVAIATALMPPLCTAGYGLATFKFEFFFGAIYLFFINTVFISVSTLFITRFLKFPFKFLPKQEEKTRAHRITWSIVLITLLPSIYFGYDIVQRNKFSNDATRFIENEAVFPNDYLLKSTIDPKKKTIILTYGGNLIEEKDIEKLKNKLSNYNLTDASLEIRQGFSYLENNINDEKSSLVSLTLNEKEKEIAFLQRQIDSIAYYNSLGKQIFRELKTQYPNIQSFVMQKAVNNTDTIQQNIWLAIIQSKYSLTSKDKNKLESWLKVRVKDDRIKIYFEK